MPIYGIATDCYDKDLPTFPINDNGRITKTAICRTFNPRSFNQYAFITPPSSTLRRQTIAQVNSSEPYVGTAYAIVRKSQKATVRELRKGWNPIWNSIVC